MTFYRILYILREFVEKPGRSFRWYIYRPLQQLFTGYSYNMAWDAHSFMAKKIYPIFRDFARLKRHSAPTHTLLLNHKDEYVQKYGEEAVETYLTGTSDVDSDLQEALFTHWNEIIEHVLFSLRFIAVDGENYPKHLEDPNPNYNPNQKEMWHSEPCKDKPRYHELIFHDDYGKTKLNMERVNEFEEYVSEGFRLLGVYWRSFWD